ncbi:MAG: hydroxylamine reductase, partial [Deltaproteobacteria bacterium]|nr:hydroxylamine reductase [Deltaproteobacteria bacterium]
MFCYQCEQTAKGEACTKAGVCGKQPDVAALQDLLTYALTGLSLVAEAGRKSGINDRDVNVFACEALFSTLTNVNFDPARFVTLIRQCCALRDGLIDKITATGGKVDSRHDVIRFTPATSIDALVAQGEKVGMQSYPTLNADILSLKHILLFGIRGVAAYMDHARILGQEDDTIYAFLHEGLSALMNEKLT